jgi:hypothetical protein
VQLVDAAPLVVPIADWPAWEGAGAKPPWVITFGFAAIVVLCILLMVAVSFC